MEKLCRNRISGGYLYLIEFGNNVKIGITTHPESRIIELANLAKNYCLVELKRIAVSYPHRNYAQNELALHSQFEDKRIGTGELFRIDFESALSAFSSLELDYGKPLNSISKSLYDRRINKKSLDPLERAERLMQFERCLSHRKTGGC